MEICIRENYIDKTALTRTHIIIDEDGKEHEELMYKREDLVKPPYFYQIVEVDDKYADCIYSDFDCTGDTFVFNIAKYNSRKEKEKNIKLINDYKRKLFETDYKAIKYAEGLISETDYAPIKAERENYRKAINSLEISLK